ncbi:MAG: YkgJ family cysteine cluster protein [Planctomycetota bacterium]|jgi:Fe-S-cluster containining protein
MGSVHCEHCTGHCCKYLALPLDKPRTPRDFDDMRWYLMHQGVTIFVEEGDWFIQFATTCKNLTPANLCGVYETRPKICREYKAGECDYAGGSYQYDHLFTHVDQIEAYAREALRKKRQRQRASRNGRAKRPTAGRRIS